MMYIMFSFATIMLISGKEGITFSTMENVTTQLLVVMVKICSKEIYCAKFLHIGSFIFSLALY